ncbi:MAG: hypothetical protein JO100_14920 [Pseudonocardia sp.]|nr:hypothetical protein [Pseudonocardia sp.]
MRDQAVPRGRTGPKLPTEATSTTELHSYQLAGDRAAAVAIGQRVTGIRRVWQPKSATTGYLWMYADPSWTCLDTTVTPYEVEQAGPRRLFDELRAAHRW